MISSGDIAITGDLEIKGGPFQARAIVWTYPAMSNGWVNYSTTGGYQQLRYTKYNGIVYMEGLVKSGTVNSDVFVLPAGYRPAAGCHLIFSQLGGSNTASRDTRIFTGGNVRQYGVNSWVSLTLCFPAA